MAAYGPLALKLAGEVGDGFILQLADVDIAAWMINTVRDRGRRRRPRPGRDHVLRGRADVRRRRLGAHARPVPLVRRHGRQPRGRHRREVRRHAATVPQALTDYIKGREGYDYNEHGQAGNTHTDFVPDEIVDRFCILGTADEHIAKLEAAQGARRRPVRRLPAARQQGGDTAGLRRDGHACCESTVRRGRATGGVRRGGTWCSQRIGVLGQLCEGIESVRSVQRVSRFLDGCYEVADTDIERVGRNSALVRRGEIRC